MTTTKAVNTHKQSKATEALEELTAKVVEAIEADPGNWTKPWAETIVTKGLPASINGYTYTGGNLILALTLQLVRGYSTGIWGTWNQWADALDQPRKGGKVVEKGQKASYLLRPQTYKVTTDDNGNKLPDDKHRSFTTFKAFAVFNADQVHGGVELALDKFSTGRTHEPIEAAEAFVANTGADIIHGGGGAFYSPEADVITLPPADTFVDELAYYHTALHELSHWTGHRNRMNRPGITKVAGEKTKADYAFEELVAELGSVFAGATLGLVVEPRPENAQYLAHWVRQMKESPKVLWKAASGASKAATFLAELQPANELVAA